MVYCVKLLNNNNESGVSWQTNAQPSNELVIHSHAMIAVSLSGNIYKSPLGQFYNLYNSVDLYPISLQSMKSPVFSST